MTRRGPYRVLAAICLVVAACGGEVATSTTGPATSSTTTAANSTTTSSDIPTLDDCPPAPYRIDVYPERVGDPAGLSEGVALDRFTQAAGSHSSIWLDDQGGLVVALIRGTLPPEEWPGDKGEVDIDGARAVAGPYADGTWVVGWFEQPGDRCDLYTMVFYPPVTPAEVQATIESMDRTAG